MKNYKLLNNITGWVAFLIAAITYILTIEPTASFWDCGEFITSSFKLEVGHPPGAPVFMILGRFFTLFAFGNLEKVPVMINIMSALASAFTILFLFWSVTHIARRVIVKATENINLGQTIAILGSGMVGALAYTFSDTFWFSAVEGEVYAMSSFFTAVVFWAILKWEQVADEKYSNRWIILIAYLMGLSIGVHLLNLLAIPAIVFVYYFKKYPVTRKGIIITSLIAVTLLGSIMYVIIQGLVLFASKFELFFVNVLKLGYNTGVVFYLLLLLGLIVFGLYYTQKKKMVILNTIILGITVIVIGYSSFALIVIRSAAKPPMDQNSPDDMFSLLGYLNREQYGDRPLFHGEYFNARPINTKEGKTYYIPKNGKYEISTKKINYIYDPQYTTVFPRMYSNQQNHPEGYMKWAGIKDNTKPPTFGQNLQYFFKYQVGFMYLRYFMWNFAGRQSDIQCHGNVMDGNWISGIPFIDNARLGDQSTLPDYLKTNPGRNAYYFLPLLLGLLGMIWLFRANEKGNKYFWVVLLFFFFTGLAIIVYLNQPPYQPRERDYAYAGSFYVFAMFIGFGTTALFDWLKKKASPNLIAGATVGICLLAAPILMASQNWDDHDRSGRYTARDFAYNYLNSCAPNAILFTNGDNDTFPLWYAQEVEGIRTDVRVINLSYLNTDWYIDQMKRKAYDSEPVPFSMTQDKYVEGKRDAVRFKRNPNIFLFEKYRDNKDIFDVIYKDLFDKFFSLLEKSTFKSVQPKDYELLQGGITKINPLQFSSLINKLSDQENIQKYNFDKNEIADIKSKANDLLMKIADAPVSLDLIVKFFTDDSPDAKTTIGEDLENYLPTNKYKIPVNKDIILKSGCLEEAAHKKIVPYIDWTVKNVNWNNDYNHYLKKSEIMILDLLATNNWERPIYFAITVGTENYINLQEYFQLEGLAYRLVPVKTNNNSYLNGRINTEILYENLINKFKWGGIDNPKVYLDENNTRMLMNIKNTFSRLAEALIQEGKKEKAIEVLNRCNELLPNNRVTYNYYDLLIAEQFYNAGNEQKGDEIIITLADNVSQELTYYFQLPPQKRQTLEQESQRAIAITHEIVRYLRKFQRKDLSISISQKFASIMVTYFPILMQAEQFSGNQQQFMQWYSNLKDEDKQLIEIYMYFTMPPK